MGLHTRQLSSGCVVQGKRCMLSQGCHRCEQALGLRALWPFLQARCGSSGADAAGTAAAE
jgi:hypothetical protein